MAATTTSSCVEIKFDEDDLKNAQPTDYRIIAASLAVSLLGGAVHGIALDAEPPAPEAAQANTLGARWLTWPPQAHHSPAIH